MTEDTIYYGPSPIKALRDAFAAHALTGIMAKGAATSMPSGTREAFAKLAYQMADAMLVERERERLQ